MADFDFTQFYEKPGESKKVPLNVQIDQSEDSTPPKKRSYRKKKTDTSESTDVAVIPPIDQITSATFITTSTPYTAAFTDTTTQLDNAIVEIDTLNSSLFTDLQTIKGSKTLKNKFNTIVGVTEVMGGLINTKISAIKEKNNIRSKALDYELKRQQLMKNQTNEQDENQQIANMYNAFINTPVGVGPSLAPSLQDLTVANGIADMRMPIGSSDQMGADYMAGGSPAQNRMILEAKGQIDTVLCYDAASGNRWFDVVDKNTRQSVPNVEKPDESTIYEIDINLRGGYAKDPNRGVTYPLVVINGNSDMAGY